ncbi:BTB/POZ domain-containing protein At5g66560 [Andrographis paniculata]|uniref:BTB/POZ domain-containing protein At5g66560 n=1 Tax=Andrographis paniculata TaxID=175694 RepID=UPI0021E962FC|nr:BTB/POZ domain-containing protein At5g66560 [Andrographis paniculata]
MAAEKPSTKGQAWFCTTGLPSDVVIEVDDMTFHLHKFPLMSKSRKLHDQITELERRPAGRTARIQTSSPPGHQSDNDGEETEEIREEKEDGEDEDEEQFRIILPDFPGGSESFETAAKFCYSVKIDITATNVAPLRCAGEYLEMTEEYSEDNLISRTERYLSQSVLRNIKHSIKALVSCEGLLPMADSLGIVQRCIEAIATRAAASDPSLFGWPVNDGSADYKGADEPNPRRKLNTATRGGAAAAVDSWLDELGFLSLPFFKRLIFAMKGLNLSAEVIESCLIHYAKKFIPGMTRTNRKQSSSSISVPTENDQRELLETIIYNLPKEKTLRSASNTTRLLLGLLRTAYILNASEDCRLTLEKKIGSQLEEATLDDLLIPSYSYLNETLYDVDCVERILAFFLEGVEERSATRAESEDENTSVRNAALMLVGKLIDGYLSEIASDANLKPEKFHNLAVALPDHARLFDDGLYRAVDVYLKAHPWIPEADREKICGVLDCQKLTLEACTHAAQNERLPLRAVVQVLFFEQLQLRHAIAGSLMAADPGAAATANDGWLLRDDEDEDNDAAIAARPPPPEASSTWRATVRENQVLRQDMDSMRVRVHELERECTTMKKAIQKIDKVGSRDHGDKGGWRAKFGCKFKTQVCDSHEPTVAEARKTRARGTGPGPRRDLQ